MEFYSKNKFEKLVHLAGFIVRIYHAARSSESQIWYIGINILEKSAASVLRARESMLLSLTSGQSKKG